MTKSKRFQPRPLLLTTLLLAMGFISACSSEESQPAVGSVQNMANMESNAISENTPAYPDWSGQWQRAEGSLNWPSEGYEQAGPPPLTDEYGDMAGIYRFTGSRHSCRRSAFNLSASGNAADNENDLSHGDYCHTGNYLYLCRMEQPVSACLYRWKRLAWVHPARL